MENRFHLIRQWATEKGIYEKGDIKTQTLKLLEETGELAKAVINNDQEEIIDAIGDCVVVLTSIAELANRQFGGDITIESCIKSAYDVIIQRTGKMENGSFIKDPPKFWVYKTGGNRASKFGQEVYCYYFENQEGEEVTYYPTQPILLLMKPGARYTGLSVFRNPETDKLTCNKALTKIEELI